MKLRTLFLEIVVVVAALATVILAVMAFWRLPIRLTQIYGNAVTAILFGIGVYINVVGFLSGCLFAWRLLRCVDRNTAFKQEAVTNLARLKWSLLVMAVGCAALLPGFMVAAQAEDAPGLMLIGCLIFAVPVVVTVFLAILQQLWTAALHYKDENDLTV